MRMKDVDRLRGGEILAEPVLTKQNDILIPKGTELKEEYVSLIQSIGLRTVMIEDPYANYETPNFFLSQERFQYYKDRIKKVLENHIYNGKGTLKIVDVIARELVDELYDCSKDMSFDMEERNADLYEHTVMVTLLSLFVAKKLRMKKERQYQLAIGCILHDLGIRYITVPYENCDWESGIASDKFEFRKHTILAYTALEEEAWLPSVAKKMILSHHERLDGSGFPLKQKNSEIECRIIQVCDAFDCMISGMECNRSNVRDALSCLQENAGTQFDQNVVDSIVSMIAKYPVGTTVKTNEEQNGVVISQTADPENPVIMILDASMSGVDERKCNLDLDKSISILQVV